MIINDINSLELLNTSVVNLWPCTKDKAEGELEVDGRSYDVKVSFDQGYRVWARVVVSKPHKLGKDPEEAALAVARKALADDSWLSFGVDPRDGEALFSTTLTADMSAAALDRFFSYSQGFLADNRDELEEMLGIYGAVTSPKQIADDDVTASFDDILDGFDSLV